MPAEWFREALAVDPISIPALIIRLLAALVGGYIVAFIYRRATRVGPEGHSFVVTLVLLTVLIAMVTQVIGDNVARAFSLVGALSIVRFRTVVRDTQDTAYVIFAVAVGMAVGANHSAVAVAGLVIVAVAAASMRAGGAMPPGGYPYVLTVRMTLGRDPADALRAAFEQYTAARRLTSVATARQGASIEFVYSVALRDADATVGFINALNLVEGVQSASVQLSEQALEGRG